MDSRLQAGCTSTELLPACALRSVHSEQKAAYVAVVHARLREPAAPKRETSGAGSKAIPSLPDTHADSRCARWQSLDPHHPAASSIPGRSREMSLRARRPDPVPSGFAPWVVLSAHEPRRTSCFTNNVSPHAVCALAGCAVTASTRDAHDARREPLRAPSKADVKDRIPDSSGSRRA